MVKGSDSCSKVPRRPLQSLFKRLKLDPRHTGLEVLSVLPIASRRYPGRSMAFKEIDRRDGSVGAMLRHRGSANMPAFSASTPSGLPADPMGTQQSR